LKGFLAEFAGCILLVSHDRYFLDRLVDHLFVFEGDGKIKDYNGSYSEYRLEQEAKEKEIKKVAKLENESTAKVKTEKPKTKLSFKEKYEFENLEQELEDLETEKGLLEAELAANPTDFDVISKASGRLTEVIKLISEKTDRWLELSEYD